MSFFSFNRNTGSLGLELKGYLGLTGSGKSLSAVENEVLPALLANRSVWSNIWLNWKNDNLRYYDSWAKLRNVRNSLIFIDEVGDFLDAHDWKNFTDEDKNIIRYHRKRGNDIVYTGQDISDIAKMVRTKTHTYVLCEKFKPNFIVLLFNHLFKIKRLSFLTMELDFADLKRLSIGIGSPALSDKLISDDDEDEYSFSDDISDIAEDTRFKKEKPEPKKIVYSFDYLERHDLNDYKLNFYGYWCSSCSAYKEYSTTSLFFTEKTFFKSSKLILPDLVNKYCPTHPKELLTIKVLGMYDTNAELILPDADDVIIKKYKYVDKKILQLVT